MQQRPGITKTPAQQPATAARPPATKTPAQPPTATKMPAQHPATKTRVEPITKTPSKSPAVGGGAPRHLDVKEPKASTTVTGKWTVKRSGSACLAQVHASCPKPEPGKPMMTCNPPAPIKYACPATMGTASSVVVVQYARSTECVIEGKAGSTKVPCPKR